MPAVYRKGPRAAESAFLPIPQADFSLAGYRVAGYHAAWGLPWDAGDGCLGGTRIAPWPARGSSAACLPGTARPKTHIASVHHF